MHYWHFSDKVNILTIFRYHIFPKTNNWRITDLEWNINRWISEERAYKTYHFYKTTIRKISFNNQSFTWEIFWEKNIIISRGFSNSYFVRKKSAITKMAPQFREFQTITLESISRFRQRSSTKSCKLPLNHPLKLIHVHCCKLNAD